MPIIAVDPKVYVVLGIVSTVLAQLLLKKSGSMPELTFYWFVILFTSLLSYSLSFVFYYYSLKNYDISTVQPIMMVSIVCMVSLYGFYAGEVFNISKTLGLFFAILSIIFISRS